MLFKILIASSLFVSSLAIGGPYQNRRDCPPSKRWGQLSNKKMIEKRRSGKASADLVRKPNCRTPGKGKFSKRKSRHD